MSRNSLYVLLVVVAIAAGFGAYRLGVALRPAPELAGTALQNPVAVTGLELIDGSGEAVDLAEDFAGELTLVFFGYTRCPDVCPLTLAQLGRIYQEADTPDDVNVVMVSVDPAYDTPAVVGEYVRRFHPDFVGLTGSNQQVARAAKTFFVGYAGAALWMRAGAPNRSIVTMPDLAGLPEAQARQTLSRLDLEMEPMDSLPNPDVEAGRVLTQSPLPGQEVAPGTAVQVILSSGQVRYPVPDVIGLTRDRAMQVLAASGMAADQKEFDVHLLGGDTVRTPGPLTLSLTAFGRVAQGRGTLQG